MNIEEQKAFYPTGADLVAMGQYLARDVCLWTARLSREYCNTHTSPIPLARAETPQPRKPPASKYVGVSLHKGRWFVAYWRTNKVYSGRMRPNTDDGARWAARSIARGLGLEYLLLRDGTREPYLWKECEEMGD